MARLTDPEILTCFRNALANWRYDLRLNVKGHLVYVETRLQYRDPTDPDDPIIQVVNIHLA
jgi:hypothetical protein